MVASVPLAVICGRARRTKLKRDFTRARLCDTAGNFISVDEPKSLGTGRASLSTPVLDRMPSATESQDSKPVEHPFQLTDLDREILAQTDEEYKYHDWEELKELLGTKSTPNVTDKTVPGFN